MSRVFRSKLGRVSRTVPKSADRCATSRLLPSWATRIVWIWVIIFPVIDGHDALIVGGVLSNGMTRTCQCYVEITNVGGQFSSWRSPGYEHGKDTAKLNKTAVTVLDKAGFFDKTKLQTVEISLSVDYPLPTPELPFKTPAPVRIWTARDLATIFVNYHVRSKQLPTARAKQAWDDLLVAYVADAVTRILQKYKLNTDGVEQILQLAKSPLKAVAMTATPESKREQSKSNRHKDEKKPSPKIPTTIAIDPDDYHAKYVGKTKDGKQFFLTPLFEPFGNEYLALFTFDEEGTLTNAEINDLGPRNQYDADEADALRAKRLRGLGKITPERIEVKPFSVRKFGKSFGLIANIDEDSGECFVNLEPGDFMSFHEPWESGEYDT
ncbi:MAG TPA: hypothetical protein V6D22_22445 [Candidatus Obscuribacterales bacterium]